MIELNEKQFEIFYNNEKTRIANKTTEALEKRLADLKLLTFEIKASIFALEAELNERKAKV